jgi:hypothetical protein
MPFATTSLPRRALLPVRTKTEQVQGSNPCPGAKDFVLIRLKHDKELRLLLSETDGAKNS